MLMKIITRYRCGTSLVLFFSPLWFYAFLYPFNSLNKWKLLWQHLCGGDYGCDKERWGNPLCLSVCLLSLFDSLVPFNCLPGLVWMREQREEANGGGGLVFGFPRARHDLFIWGVKNVYLGTGWVDRNSSTWWTEQHWWYLVCYYQTGLFGNNLLDFYESGFSDYIINSLIFFRPSIKQDQIRAHRRCFWWKMFWYKAVWPENREQRKWELSKTNNITRH